MTSETVEVKVMVPEDQVFLEASDSQKLVHLWYRMARIERQIVAISRTIGTGVDIPGY